MSEDDPIVILDNGSGLEFVLEKAGFRFAFRQQDGGIMVSADPEAGLLAGEPGDLKRSVSSEYRGKTAGLHAFEVTLEDGRKITVRMEFGPNAARFELENPDGEAIAMALRGGGASPGYGLGDMVSPLYGEDYETAQTRDVYLPEGVWIDYDDGKRYTGPILLEGFGIPVTKTPLFVGGTGIVVEEIEGKLMARIYPVAERAETTFYGKDGETKSTITIADPDWRNPEFTELTTGEKIVWEKVRHAHQFGLVEGHDYVVR